MSRPKNVSIGTVECPQKGCTQRAAVYRFQARTAGLARFAGKLYAECPTHGRYGADGKQGAQEYILENATITGGAAAPPIAAAPPRDMSPPIAAPSSPAPIAAPPPAKRDPWGDWAPLIK